MKRPQQPVIGGARKSLPTRKSRKIGRRGTPSTRVTSARSRSKFILDKNAEQEMVRIFDEK
jgi:hypothetical protein